jgi:SAM-dependent methyltransferase
MFSIKRLKPTGIIRILEREYKFAHTYLSQRKFRKLKLPNASGLIKSENSSDHWNQLDVSDKVVLDLGCGFWDVDDIQESSPIYFKKKGAKKIIGVDLNENDIKVLKDYFPEHFKGDGSEFLVKKITKTNDLLELITKYNIESIKCDIEGFEKVMFNINKNQIENIKNLSVEYHDHVLFMNLVNTLNKWGFKITDHSVFTYGPQNMGVLTAIKG